MIFFSTFIHENYRKDVRFLSNPAPTCQQLPLLDLGDQRRRRQWHMEMPKRKDLRRWKKEEEQELSLCNAKTINPPFLPCLERAKKGTPETT